MLKTKSHLLSVLFTSSLFVFALSDAALAKFTAEDAAQLEANAAATVAQLASETPGAEEVLAGAKGVLVCPKITKGGLGFGAEGGQCVLTSGAENPIHYGTFGVKGGFIAGIQSHSMVLAINTDEALARFTSGDREWELGVDASVAVAEIGAGGDLDTSNLKSSIVSFIFGQKGLMADVSWKGSRFKKLDIE